MFTFLSFILLDLLAQTRSIWLVTPPSSWLWIALLDTSGSQSGWMTSSAPECILALDSGCTCDYTVFIFVCFCLCLGDEVCRVGAHVCVLKSVISRPTRPLISALRRPLGAARPLFKKHCCFLFDLKHSSRCLSVAQCLSTDYNYRFYSHLLFLLLIDVFVGFRYSLMG